jgi:dipeptide transport system substrate-binding protein
LKNAVKYFGYFLILLLSVSCTKKNSEKTFIYCSEGSPSSFNPQLTTDTPSQVAANAVYNRLVEYERDGTFKIIPRLAEWKLSDNGLEYVFTLRKNVKFHKTAYFTPTRDMNADDVLFSFNRQWDQAHPYHQVSGGKYAQFQSIGMDKVIKSIEKINDATIKFVLNAPDATFLSNLAMAPFSILSAEYADQLTKQNKPEQIDINPVGTGPFVFQKYDKDSMIRFTANPDYFLGASPLSKLVFVIVTDQNTRTQKILKGECDLAAEPAPTEYQTFLNDKNLKVVETSGMNVGYLSMNILKKPFDKLKVRQAVSHALNLQSYIDAIFLGFGTVANSPVPSSMWAYNDKLPKHEYNPTKAKELLKEAGFADGFETDLWALPVSRPYNPDGKKMAEMMQADLAQVGIRVKIVSYDWPTYLTKGKNAEHTMGQFGWTPNNADPDNFLNTLLSCDAAQTGPNRSRWCDAEFDRLVKEAKSTSNIEKRTKLYQQAQERVAQEMPWVPLAYSKIFRVMSKKVVGYKIDPIVVDVLYGVDLQD